MSAVGKTARSRDRLETKRGRALARREARARREVNPSLVALAAELERAAARCLAIAAQQPLERILQFLQIETVRAEGCTSAADLFRRYQARAAALGVPAEHSPLTFGKKLQALGMRSRKTCGRKVWIGIALVDHPPPCPLGEVSEAGMVRRDGGLLAASVAAVTAALTGMDARNSAAPSPSDASHHP